MRCAALVVATVLGAATSIAAARKVAPDPQVQPAPSWVRGKLEGDVATFTARFAIELTEPTYSTSVAMIELPPHALVTAATASLGGVAHPLALLPTADAEAAFQALSSGEPTGTGELVTGIKLRAGAGGLHVDLATPRPSTVVLELQLASPTCFHADARYVAVPTSWRPALAPALRRVHSSSADLIAACGEPAPTATSGEVTEWVEFAIPRSEGPAARPSGDRLVAIAGRADLGAAHVVRVELDLAAVLSDVPPDLATVILVDGSSSLTADGVEAQRQLVASYLAGVGRTRVQIIAYARYPRALLPGWTAASQAAPRLDRELRALAPRNGSNVDAGLAEAAAWLGRIRGTRRIVLFTDELLAERLTKLSTVTLRRVLPEATLVHAVALDRSASQPARDEAGLFAPLTAATDGIAVRAGLVNKGQALDARMLVRPLSIDGLHVTAPGWTELALDGSEPSCANREESGIDEGQACTWWGRGARTAGPISVEGLVWGKRVVRVLTPDPGRGRDLARALATYESTPTDLRAAAHTLARAVDDSWSLFASWGGHRIHDGAGLFGFGSTGGSSSLDGGTGRLGHGSFTGIRPVDQLDAQLRPLAVACHLAPGHTTINLETTLREIVDVTVSISGLDDDPDLAAHQTCLEEAVWDLSLALAHPEDHHVFLVSL